MNRDELREWRRKRLEVLTQDYGGATKLGQAIGHSSGAQISGMIAKTRLISERTIFAIEELPGLRGYFTGNIEQKPIAVGEILSGLTKILRELEERDAVTARYAVHYLIDHPEKLGEVIERVAELRRNFQRGKVPGTSPLG